MSPLTAAAAQLSAAVHARTSAVLAAADVPDGKPQAPPGLDDLATTWIGYAKWAVLVAGVFGLVICAIMMIMGRRNRSSMAVDGVTGVPWVIGGIMIASLAATIVGAVSV